MTAAQHKVIAVKEITEMAPTYQETVFQNVLMVQLKHRDLAQRAYDLYEFDRKVVDGQPHVGWFATFDLDTPSMTRKLAVLTDDGSQPGTGWFRVVFDKTGTEVIAAYASIGKDLRFGSLSDESLCEINGIEHVQPKFKM